MATFELFVGSNNETHQVERDRLEAILSAHVDGYTVTDCHGMWRGQREDSASVLLTIPRGELPGLLAELRQSLAQDAIAYRKVPALKFAS
jgi:hypothetical protein